MVKVFIGAKFDVTPQGAVVTRGLSIGGNSVAGPNDLSLADSTQDEAVSMPCTAKARDNVHYGLDPYHWTPAAAVLSDDFARRIWSYQATQPRPTKEIDGWQRGSL